MAITAYELRDMLNRFEAEREADDEDASVNVWQAILWGLLRAFPSSSTRFDHDGMTFTYDAHLNRWDYVTAHTPQEG